MQKMLPCSKWGYCCAVLGVLEYSPPIYFTRKKVKTGDTSGDKANNYKTVTLLVNPEDLESEIVEKKVHIFGGDKTPEDWVKWQIKFNKVVQDIQFSTCTVQQTRKQCALLYCNRSTLLYDKLVHVI
jgi:hypothetical protein